MVGPWGSHPISARGQSRIKRRNFCGTHCDPGAGELLKLGISVPREVSIISRDPSTVFERVSPRIASYLFDPTRHARAVCRILHGGKATGQWLIPKFDEGESLAPPPLP